MRKVTTVKKKVARKKQPKSKGNPYASMIMDPCNSRLQPGLFGSNYGLLARFRKTYGPMAPFTGMNYGYVIWFPALHNNAAPNSGTNHQVSFVYYGTTNPTTNPTSVDFGIVNPLSATAQSFADPAHDFINGDTCSDARTLSACMKLTYMGQQASTKGLVATLTNIPLSVVLDGGVGGVPPSVDQMLNYATKQHRPLEDSEVTWRPDALDATFRRIGTPCIQCSPGVASAYPVSTEIRPPTGIGFVFYNVLNLADFNLAAFKNIEWRAEPSSGLTIQQPSGSENPSVIANSLNFLDRNFPGWQSKAKDTAVNMVGNALSNMVLGGSYRSGASAPNYVNLVSTRYGDEL